jgi:hypothetical protein
MYTKDILQNKVLLVMSTQKRLEQCKARVPLMKTKGAFAGSLINIDEFISR